MNKYQIGDWVVLNTMGDAGRRACQIDGIRLKVKDAKLVIQYEEGDFIFAEHEIIGSLTFHDPKERRTRRTKAEMTQAEDLPNWATPSPPDSAA